jgi:hypothetical protein
MKLFALNHINETLLGVGQTADLALSFSSSNHSLRVMWRQLTMAFALSLSVVQAIAADCVHGVAYTAPGALTCTIPGGVSTVKVVAKGAGGGGGWGAAGGSGAQVQSTLSVSPTQVLSMFIGGGGTATGSGGGGGGSTNIDAGTANQIIAGGGGGGATGGAVGGAGGMPVGTSGG